ncbi:MAG: hypothetical protein II820_06345 [Ruminiclostridium sp.]|nr:hypothetical protein [Ruminiclostridium sp.]
MENILKKALDEVLTPRYSDELRDSYDTGYAVTAGFEEKMRELIRRTDKPPVKWQKYAAAAAAAVILISSIVLVPIIMNNRVDVSPPTVPEDTTAEVTTAPYIEGVYEESISLYSVTSESDMTTPQVSEETEINEIDYNENASGVITESTSGEEPAVTAPAETTPAGTVTVSEAVAEAAPVSSETTMQEDVEESYVDEEEAEEAESESEYDVAVPETETGIPSRTSVNTDVPDSPDDDIVIVDIDDDKERPEDEEYEECAEEEEIEAINVIVPKGTTLSQVFADNFGITFDDLWATSGGYCPEGAVGDYGQLYLDLRDLDFLQNFVHKLGNAECVDAPEQTMSETFIDIVISDVQNKIGGAPEMRNDSQWLYYDRYFGVPAQSGDIDEEIYEEEEVIEDEPENEKYKNKNMSVLVRITRKDCIVRFDDYLCIYKDSIGNTVYYKINGDFRMPESDVRELFEKTEKLYIPETVRTVGDIAVEMGITADNIVDQFANVSGVYDTSISFAKIDSRYIADLFVKYGSQPVEDNNSHFVFNGVTTLFGLKNSNARFTVAVDRDNKVYIFTGLNFYWFEVPQSELINALNEVSMANGINIPVYSTLGEYLTDKNFTKLISVGFNENFNGREGRLQLTDAAELEILTEMLKAEFPTAAYEMGHRLSNKKDIRLGVKDYRVLRINITADDRFVIQATNIDVFKLSDGFYNRFKKAVLESRKYSFDVSDDSYDADEPDMPDGDINPIT